MNSSVPLQPLPATTDQAHDTTDTTDTTPTGHMKAMTTPRPPKPGQSLADKFPDIAAQWHPTMNGGLTPDQVSAGSHTKAWWRCEQGHEWKAEVNSRTSQGSGCPVHAGQKLLAGYNDLATTFPAVAAQWHPTRNGDLIPDRVLAGTAKKAWWRCEDGHEWEATVAGRTSSRGSGCPV